MTHRPARPTPSAAPPAPAAPASSSLDLSPPAAPAPASSSLDLSVPAVPVVPEPVAVVEPVVPAVSVAAGQRRVLSPADPTVTLSRVQSAIGTLTIEAAASESVGDVRLGCAYELRSGVTSTVQVGSGNRFGPPGAKRPVLLAAHERYDRIGVDLRQCRELRRFAVYVFSDSRRQLTWGGTLLVTLFSGAKVEVPLEAMGTGEVGVVLTGYLVRGRLVLRAELQPVTGSIREACRAFGYDRVTWLDDRTPVD